MDRNNKKIFRAKLNTDFFLINNRFVLSDEYKKQITPKKLTGSRFGEIFDSKSSSIKTWMKMFNLYNEPFEELYSKTGNVIEPKLRDYYMKLTNSKILSYDPAEVKWDIFKNNRIFGGIPDGEPINENNQEIDYDNDNRMIEIKTSSIDSFVFKKENGFFYMQKEDDLPVVKIKNSKYESWFEDNKIVIPNSYLFQLSLYMYLRNIEHGVFIIGFVPTQNYKKPEEFDVNKNEVKIVNYELNLNEFKEFINYGKKWWKTYIDTGISPELSKEDLDWFNEAYDNN